MARPTRLIGFDDWAMKTLTRDNFSSKCWDVEISQNWNAWKWQRWIVAMCQRWEEEIFARYLL